MKKMPVNVLVWQKDSGNKGQQKTEKQRREEEPRIKPQRFHGRKSTYLIRPGSTSSAFSLSLAAIDHLRQLVSVQSKLAETEIRIL